MTLLFHRSDVGEDLRAPETLAPRRRRLSTLAPRRMRGRPCIVSVHRRGSLLHPSDETVRLRKQWRHTLVGPQDVVVFTYLPLGGAMGGGGGQNNGKAIGAAVAMIAVAVAAPWLVGALGSALGTTALGTATSLTFAGKILAAGIIAGAAYFISKATKPKANKEEDSRPLFGVSGGGNTPRPGDRIPVHYGRVWSQPDLSQPDFFRYVGAATESDQILYKRMTIGAGKYKIHSLRVGQALMWTEGKGLHPPFTNAEIEFIEPGQKSSLVPGAVYSSESVTGVELGFEGDDDAGWRGPFPVTAPGVKTSRIQLDVTWPQGAWTTHPRRPGNLPTPYGVQFEYAPVDADGRIIGSYQSLHFEQSVAATTRAMRRSYIVNVPEGMYVVRARNYTQRLHPSLEQQGVRAANGAVWDGLRAHLFNEPLRPDVTEIAMKISAEAMGNTMSFADVWVETTSILDCYRGGSTWLPVATRKAVDCAVDILGNQIYGGAYPDSQIDLDKFYYYLNALDENDTFDGTIRGPVSVYEAAATVLGVIRAEPVLVGDVWTMVRDEPRAYKKHVISRRQIVQGTTGADFDLDMSNGDSDCIVEYYVDGDPRKRAEVRATIGAQTITPKRIRAFGVSTHGHATMLARWYAASAYYRRESRVLTTERLGRVLMRNDPALVESWFMDATVAAGVESYNGNLTLSLDVDVTIPAGAHLVLRDIEGMEWGPVAITSQPDSRTIVLSGADVTVVEGTTGRSLPSLFTRSSERRQPVTAMIGTLAELPRPYIIRSARPEGEDRTLVEAIYDAPEVWSILGEAVPPGPPITEILEDESDLAPVLPWLRAFVTQKATAAVLEWSVGVARGCRRYRVDLAYSDPDTGGWQPWERVHLGGQTEGSYVIEYRKDVTVRVRAVAINGRGIASNPLYIETQLTKPVVNNEIADLIIQIQDLQEQVQKDIRSITELGAGTLRNDLKRLSDKVEELAQTAATEAGQSYEQRNLVKLELINETRKLSAAILAETNIRLEQDSLLAEDIQTIVGRLDDSVTGLEAQAAAIDSIKVAIDLQGTGLTAYSQKISSLETTVNGADGQGGIARATENLKAAVGLQGDGTTAEATKITALETSVNGKTGVTTGLITQMSQVRATTGDDGNASGLKFQHGVTFSANGNAIGGYVMSGIRRLDGGWSTSFGIMGDLIVTGTITGSKLVTNSAIITGQLQVGSLVVHHDGIVDDAVTRADGASSSSSEKSIWVTITTRAKAKVAVIGTYNGSPGTARVTSNAGTLWLQRDGTTIRSSANNYTITDYSGGSYLYALQTTIIDIDYPTAGAHTYYCKDEFEGGVNILVMELAK